MIAPVQSMKNIIRKDNSFNGSMYFQLKWCFTI